MNSGAIEERFHYYVRPTICPKLSSYCINLTGITQSLVDDQDTFPSIYRKFEDWIQRIENDKGAKFATPSQKHASGDECNATFCSWSNFDLKFYFRKECERADVDTPSRYKAWIDVIPHYDVSFYHNSFLYNDLRKI